jgi:hypothetical protein
VRWQPYCHVHFPSVVSSNPGGLQLSHPSTDKNDLATSERRELFPT